MASESLASSSFSTGEEALTSAITSYTSTNSKSKAIFDKSLSYLPGANTRTVLYSSPFPLAFSSGKGATITSTDGREYVDFLGEYTAGLLGHSHPEIAKEIIAAAQDGWSFGGVNIWEGQLAAKVCERFRLENVRFTNSGTEANLMALGAAKVFTAKSKIIVFENGYHGGVLSFKPPVAPITVPHDFMILPYNSDVRSAAESLVSTSSNGGKTSSLAAILVEPMQGSAGCYVPDDDWLESLRTVCDEHSALLIFDEVMTSRLHLGGLQCLLGIKPDLTTLGKYLGGGFSFGAFGGRADVMSMFDPRKDSTEGGGIPHSGTFNNNIFSMRAGLKAMDILSGEELHKVNALGVELKSKLNAIFRGQGIGPNRVEATGIGSLMNIHFFKKGQSKEVPSEKREEDKDLMDLFWFYMVENGIYFARRGFIALTIAHTSEMVERFVEVSSRFVQEHKEFLV